MTVSRRALSHAFASVLLCATGHGAAQDRLIEDLANFPRGSVEIHSGPRRHRFEVWIADTPARQSQGLMFVSDLAPHRGMLFVHGEPREASMWMKNTYIPLDMLFIDSNKRIVKIVARTEPHSLTSVRGDGPAIAVLELKGGEAARRGVRVGDRVDWVRGDGRVPGSASSSQ